jgi:hypothetical protein
VNVISGDYFKDSIEFQSLQEKLKQISKLDQKILTNFFYYLITESSFAYTLFGNKPISFKEFSEDLNKNTLENLLYPYADTILGQGWETWEKYKYLFSHPQFIFNKVQSRSGYTFIVLINKKACLDVIHKYLADFRSVLGENKNIQEIFEEISSKHIFFEDSIENNQFLLGMLLGYGRENSLIFFERDQICSQIVKRNISPIFRSFQSSEINSSATQLIKLYEKFPKSEWNEDKDPVCVSLLCRRLEEIQKNTEAFNSPAKHWINKIGAPEFLSLKNSFEREELEQKYQETLEFLKEINLMNSLLPLIIKCLSHE